MYILDGKVPVPCYDTKEWAEKFGKADNSVAKTEIGDVIVSTVFLGLDHAFYKDEPQLFETMVFGGSHNECQQRYATWEEAEEGHKEMCKKVVAGQIELLLPNNPSVSIKYFLDQEKKDI